MKECDEAMKQLERDKNDITHKFSNDPEFIRYNCVYINTTYNFIFSRLLHCRDSAELNFADNCEAHISYPWSLSIRIFCG